MVKVLSSTGCTFIPRIFSSEKVNPEDIGEVYFLMKSVIYLSPFSAIVRLFHFSRLTEKKIMKGFGQMTKEMYSADKHLCLLLKSFQMKKPRMLM